MKLGWDKSPQSLKEKSNRARLLFSFLVLLAEKYEFITKYR